MPNIKSQIKRVSISRQENAENNSKKSRIKNLIKKFDATVAEGNKEEATALLNKAFSLIDQAAQDNIYHKNTAARKKASLAKKLNTIA